MKLNIATLMAVYRGDDPTRLAMAIDSVLGQRFVEAVESRLYLVVDGPVPEEIDAVIARYQELLYLVLRLPENCGLASALNALIKKLSDETYIFRMDSDDRSYLDRYQAQLDYFRQHPEVDILGTDIIEIDTGTGSRRRIGFCRGHEDAIKKLCLGVPVAHPTVCFRRAVLDHVGGYPASGTNEDIALWFKCALAGFKFDNVREPLLEFTVSPNFWRRRSLDKAYVELRCYVAGIWAMHGATWRYVFPFMRFVLRIAPRWFSRLAYGSSMRRAMRRGESC